MSKPARVAVVTGGSSGIGRGISLALARRGYRLLIVGRTPEKLDEALRLLRDATQSTSGDTHLGVALDVSQEFDAQDMASKALERFGRIDLLITSAGIGRQRGGQRLLPYPTHSLPSQEWDEVLAVNLTGVFLTNRAVLPAMIAQGEGHIINVCSSTTPYGLRGTAYGPAYCSSKFAVVGFTESLAQEVEHHGIRVQALFPGPVSTALVSQTTLARPFGGSLTVESFAESVVRLLDTPADTVIVHPHLLPSRIPDKTQSGGPAWDQPAL